MEKDGQRYVLTFPMTSRLTNLKYKEKIQELMNEYHLGYSRIEDIINMEEE